LPREILIEVRGNLSHESMRSFLKQRSRFITLLASSNAYECPMCWPYVPIIEMEGGKWGNRFKTSFELGSWKIEAQSLSVDASCSLQMEVKDVGSGTPVEAAPSHVFAHSSPSLS